MLLYGKSLSPALPLGAISFLFILGLTPHVAPFVILFLLLFPSFLLN
jgi:hypothetical protein